MRCKEHQRTAEVFVKYLEVEQNLVPDQMRGKEREESG